MWAVDVEVNRILETGTEREGVARKLRSEIQLLGVEFIMFL